MHPPVIDVVLSFFGYDEIARICVVCSSWRRYAFVYTKQRRLFLLHRAAANYNKQVAFVSEHCANLRTVDVRTYAVNASNLVELIKHAPLLEVFLSKTSKTNVINALRECPHLTALSLSGDNLDMSKLVQFESLRALEMGDYRSLISVDFNAVRSILRKNPKLELLHTLYFQDSFKFVDVLDATKIRSLSFPYEQTEITVDKVDMLRQFTRLENVNFGQSDIADASVLFRLARDHPNLRSLSFQGSHAMQAKIALALANGDIFPRLLNLGCRNKNRVYKDVQERRDIQLYDYELKRESPHLWCHEPFDIWTLIQLYTFTPDT